MRCWFVFYQVRETGIFQLFFFVQMITIKLKNIFANFSLNMRIKYNSIIFKTSLDFKINVEYFSILPQEIMIDVRILGMKSSYFLKH
jgi:hypothetical protein